MPCFSSSVNKMINLGIALVVHNKCKLYESYVFKGMFT